MSDYVPGVLVIEIGRLTLLAKCLGPLVTLPWPWNPEIRALMHDSLS